MLTLLMTLEETFQKGFCQSTCNDIFVLFVLEFLRGADECKANRISKTEQKLAQWKARAKASPTELSSSDLSCSIRNRQFRAKIGLISHLRTYKQKHLTHLNMTGHCL